ncbi:hypothetical protein D6792_02680 [Candidatus Parcubacteria bacterium]|nr:MAG: hypothetical protein D6792_02680 [Candidatus Parcubacteria bacterium]GIW68912.1 MAG: hypothetical protein KatS3mg100_406 [Candidatus Parcubacteria bacterium]
MKRIATLTVSVANPERLIFSGEAVQVAAWTQEGAIVILPHHTPYAAPLVARRPLIITTPDGNTVCHEIGTEGGIVSVSGNTVHILLG